MTRAYYRGRPDERFWRRVYKLANGCWEWTGSRSTAGYGTFGVTTERTTTAHRFSWEIHNGPIPRGLFVCHSCDNPPCVNPAHLFLGTATDNNADMRAKGRGCDPPRKAGEHHHRALLTSAQVTEIRRRYIPRVVTRRMLAEEFGVSVATIKAVIDGRNWREVYA